MTKVKDRTTNARSARYEGRQADRDLVRVHPWVPACRKKELLSFAEKLRDEEAKKARTVTR